MPVDKVKKYEARLYEKLEHEYLPWLERIEGGSWEKSDIEELKDILTELK